MIRRYLWLLPLIGFLGVFLWGMNSHFPSIGSDFRYNVAHLIDGTWHIQRQGLTPFMYTPHFCGGFAEYGNPNDLFYSLPQMLSVVMDPWIAIQISLLFALIVGYIGWFFVGRDVLGYTKPWSHVLATILTANGYYFAHMAVGHLSYQSVPLAAWAAWAVFDRRTDTRRSLLSRACIFTLTAGYMLYSGGYMPLLMTIMGLGMALPIVLLITKKTQLRQRGKTILLRLLWCSIGAIAICGSKYVAMESLMKAFPRYTDFDKFGDDVSTLAYVLKAFWAIPQRASLFSGLPWSMHEHTSFISPVILFGIFSIPALLSSHIEPFWKKNRRRMILFGIYVALLFLFFLQLFRGYGFLATAVHHLPLFSSTHVVTRFLIIPAVFLSIAGITCLAILSRRMSGKYDAAVAFLIALSTVFFFIAAYKQGVMDLDMSEPYGLVRQKMFASAYLTTPVSDVKDGEGDVHYVLDGDTGLHCYEPLIDSGGNPQDKVLQIGPTDLVKDGAYNLMNPSCYQYPAENKCKPGDRILLSDAANYDHFRNGLPVTWKESTLQHIANWISLMTLLLSILYLVTCKLGFAPHVPEFTQKHIRKIKPKVPVRKKRGVTMRGDRSRSRA